MKYFLVAASVLATVVQAAYLKEARHIEVAPGQPTDTPDYWQRRPEIFEGPYEDGAAPFLAETDPVRFAASQTFIPSTPLQTSQPIGGEKDDSIWRLMGNVSPYSPTAEGFGVDEYPLPAEAKVSQLHMVARHGARFPQLGSPPELLGQAIKNSSAAGNKFTGKLSWMNDYEYTIGSEGLTRQGHMELFEAGVQHYYQYGALWNPNTTIVSRTTTQHRMRESAEYFLAGFFGLDWTENPKVKLEFIIEEKGFNNSLDAAHVCSNGRFEVSKGGSHASKEWQGIYLKNAVKRLNKNSGSFNWTATLAHDAQTLCSYETMGIGYSKFCELFTHEEWQGFDYSHDLKFAGDAGFQCPTGRAVGAGWVQEVLGRLEQVYPVAANTSNNVTLSSMPETFPLDQTIYFDFSHDTTMISMLTALGLKQFNEYLPPRGPPPPNRANRISRISPFGTRFDMEIITAPQPVKKTRSTDRTKNAYETGGETKYVRLIINQRTVPLGKSYKACGNRMDGWCELNTFVKWQHENLDLARYDESCFGDYKPVEFGKVTDGVPVS